MGPSLFSAQKSATLLEAHIYATQTKQRSHKKTHNFASKFAGVSTHDQTLDRKKGKFSFKFRLSVPVAGGSDFQTHDARAGSISLDTKRIIFDNFQNCVASGWGKRLDCCLCCCSFCWCNKKSRCCSRPCPRSVFCQLRFDLADQNTGDNSERLGVLFVH